MAMGWTLATDGSVLGGLGKVAEQRNVTRHLAFIQCTY
jgi:hypothetical protein